MNMEENSHQEALGNTVEDSLWIDSQLTQFDDVLRHSYDKPLEEFGEVILTNMCQTLNSIRGGFFLVDDEQSQVTALAGYACTPSTMPKSRYEVGEGLIGQVVKTQDTLYYDNLYNSKISLDSSAGPVYAGAMIVIPITFNDRVYGVIELLFMHGLEKKYRELIQRLSANIAAMLQSILNNAKTKQLLELSMQQAEELQASEEELRQNLEEVEAIQEELHRKSQDFQNRLEALDASELGSIEFTPQGTIITANNAFLNLMGYTLEEVQGKHHQIFVGTEYGNSKEYRKFWESLAEGHSLRGEFKRFCKDGKPVYISGAYMSIEIGDPKEQRIWKLVTNITALHDQLIDSGYEVDDFSRIKK